MMKNDSRLSLTKSKTSEALVGQQIGASGMPPERGIKPKFRLVLSDRLQIPVAALSFQIWLLDYCIMVTEVSSNKPNMMCYSRSSSRGAQTLCLSV